MANEALEKFTGFLHRAQQALRSDPIAAPRGNVRLLHSSPASLAERVATLEKSQEFQALCKTIESHMGAKGFGSYSWKNAIGTWCRRSGLYHRVALGEPATEATSLLESLQAELARQESTVTYLALIEHVYFHERQLDFERYEITRFTKDQLDALLQTQVRADFYPWAAVPTSELSRYWWLVIRQPTRTRDLARGGRIAVNFFEELDIVRRYYTELPLPVELVLQELALFAWRHDWATDNDPSWAPCRIPICLKADDHLTTSPTGPRADTSVLDTEPDFDPYTNEEIGERPTIRFSFNAKEAKAFEVFVRREGALLHRALETRWSRELVEVASKFFAKAFVSYGLEQLLWHITTIEALIGEDGPGLTGRLLRRLPSAIGTSDEDRKKIRKTFEQLYKFRSELVHGAAPGKDVLTRHLFEAREFARNLLRWHLRLLDDIQKAADAAGSDSGIPDRKQILGLLDLGSEGICKARALLPTLPSTFPMYPDQAD